MYLVTVTGSINKTALFTDRDLAIESACIWVEWAVWDGTEYDSHDGKIYWSDASYMKSWKRGKVHEGGEYDDDDKLIGFEGGCCSMTIREIAVVTEAPNHADLYREVNGEEPPWLSDDEDDD